MTGLAKRDHDNREIPAHVVDLAPQKAAERAARENREYMVFAVQGANVGVWDWNISDGNLIFNERRRRGY